MNACINKKSYEYRSLSERTGLSDLFLEAEIIDYADKHNGRWPTPAEIDGSDTTEHAREFLELQKNNTIETSKLTDKFQVDTVDEAVVLLNTQDTYNDLEFDILPLNKTSIVNISHRPSKYNNNFEIRYKPDEEVNSKIVLDTAFGKLATLYGIHFKQVYLHDLHNDPMFKDVIAVDPNPKAFILNGQIYINMNNYSVDSPIHELSHMLIGQLRFAKPELYMQLISLSEQLPGYDKLARTYPNRSRNDINEEIFVTEYSKFITGQKSVFDSIDPDIAYQVQFQVNRMIDTMLEGSFGIRDLKLQDIGKYSLKQIADLVNSSKMTSVNSFPLEDSSIHRKLNNMKSAMLKSGQLKEVCD